MKVSNRGFSLVELVIVIAIMAVLVALLAPQYIKYVEKSKLATDEEIIDNIQHVIAMAVADENINYKPLDGLPLDVLENINRSGKYDDFTSQIMLDLATDDLSTIKKRLKSKKYKDKRIYVEILSNQQVIVSVYD